MISGILSKISHEYNTEKEQSINQNRLAQYIRKESPEILEQIINRPDIRAKGSPGQGNWADVPWVSIFNIEITISPTRGYYLVYLFDSDMQRVSLCLAQGVTTVREEFKRRATDEILRRSALIRDRVPLHAAHFKAGPTQFGGSTPLSRDYNSSVAFYVPYKTNNLPREDKLQNDLFQMLRAYDLLFENAGTDNLETAIDASVDDDLKDQFGSIEEKKRYVRHTRIERHSNASKAAKTALGYVCQVCDFDFGKAYGEVGRGFIEAHHLIPLASLPEGKPIPMDPAEDFAVLCSNCHRIAHRRKEPYSIIELKKMLKKHFD
ncbi:DUF3578 domain-containing protein [Nisaea sp.]|uniref:MrcB family domain-containing protein n=1 Tax=Nisaea sp. TaxID=2024842 RepID=UPI003299227A